jgi:hypothetical protein
MSTYYSSLQIIYNTSTTLRDLQNTTALSEPFQSAVFTYSLLGYGLQRQGLSLMFPFSMALVVWVNFCWPTPAQSSLVPVPAGLMTILFCLRTLGVVHLLPPALESHWITLNSIVTDRFGNTISNNSSAAVWIFVSTETCIKKLLHSSEHLCDTSLSLLTFM